MDDWNWLDSTLSERSSLSFSFFLSFCCWQFDDPGAIAQDNLDSIPLITSRIVTFNPVDTTTPNLYTITYDVTGAQMMVHTSDIVIYGWCASARRQASCLTLLLFFIFQQALLHRDNTTCFWLNSVQILPETRLKQLQEPCK